MIGASLLTSLLIALALRGRPWPPVDSGCGAQLSGEREIVECYARGAWFNRSDDQPGLGESACDLFMRKLQNGEWRWEGLSDETRRAMGDCVRDRAAMDALRHLEPAALQWLPQDLLYNAYRQYALGGDLVRLFAVVWQWDSDSREAPDVWASARYESHWTALGLNTSHYEAVREATEVLQALETFRLQHGLHDYLVWNGVAHQQQSARWLVGLIEKEL